MAKRYYWLKMPDDWFQQKPIKKLRKIAGGDTYTIIYLKMLLAAIKQDGKLFFEGVEDNFCEELALEIDEDPENVKIALSYLFSQNLVKMEEADEYSLPEAVKLTGSESASAERMRRMRERRLSQCDTDVTNQLRLGDVEIEKEIEKEKREYKNLLPGAKLRPAADAGAKKPGSGVEGIDATAGYGMKEIDAKAGNGVKKVDTATENEAGKPSPKVFIHLPLNDGTMFGVTEDYVDEMKSLYPAVDVDQELRSMLGWLNSNPKNRKTKSGIKRFMNGWLAREQNKAPRERNNQQAVRKNSFNNFDGRKYNYDELERQLLRTDGIGIINHE